MKQLISILIAFVLFSFKGYSKENIANISKTKQKIIAKDQSGLSSVDEYYYVNAKSGLNYRETPKGKILGKFSLNTYLKVIKKTEIIENVKDGNIIIKGEWVGVEKELDTVYVFDAYLSKDYTQSEMKIYSASPYTIESDGTRTRFLNLSDTYFNNYENRKIINSNSKDTVRLNAKQRRLFLKTINVAESDSVYLIDLISKILHTYSVNDLPAIACVNIYASDSPEDDYEFGLDLGRFNGGYDNIAYVGKSNPFQIEKLKSIFWKEIDAKDFPIAFDTKIIDKDIRSWFDDIKLGKSYKFTNNNYDYYLQNLMKKGNVKYRYLVVIDTETNQIVYNDAIVSHEGAGLAPINIIGKNNENEPQYTGKIFKNKPSIIFGFYWVSFGCESIEFLDEKEPPIWILCDNRH